MRSQGEGPTLRAALVAARLRAAPLAQAAQARIEVDIGLARRPMFWQNGLAFAFSIAPGRDGLLLEMAGTEVAFLPQDLISDQLLTGLAPFPFMEFEFGIDVPALTTAASRRMSIGRDTWLRTPKRWQRLQVESFVEASPGGEALPVVRANV